MMNLEPCSSVVTLTVLVSAVLEPPKSFAVFGTLMNDPSKRSTWEIVLELVDGFVLPLFRFSSIA